MSEGAAQRRCVICEEPLEAGQAVRDAAGRAFCPRHAALADAPAPADEHRAWVDADSRAGARTRPTGVNHTTSAELAPSDDASTEGLFIRPRPEQRAQAEVPLGESDGGIFAFVEPETAVPVAARGCGNCGRLIDPAARICVHCGFDRQRGVQRQTVEAPPIEPEAPERPGLFHPEAPWRQTVWGWCVGAVAGASAGAVLWVIVGLAAGSMLGVMAWAVGIGAGLAVAIVAQERACFTSGCVAMAATGVVIAIARGVLSANLPLKSLLDDAKQVQSMTLSVPPEVLNMANGEALRQWHYLHAVGIFGAAFMLLAVVSAYLLGKGSGRVW